MKVLVTGIAGKIGQRVGVGLAAHGHDVVGIDRRPWPEVPSQIRFFECDIRKRAAEDVFRTEQPQAVVHMATVTHLTAASSEDRYRINLGGTKTVFDFCHRYGVAQAIFVGRHTYYGAAPDSVLYHTEDEPPLALETFPELADLVAADLFAGTALWRFPEIDTAVLRVVYTLGPSRSGTLASFLRGPRVPMVFGYDPLFQFLHEDDVARAIIAALEARLRGVYNVTGPHPLPLSLMAREAGHQVVRVPESLFRLLLGRFGLPKLPPGALSHIKFPVVVDGSAFVEKTGFEHRYDEYQTIAEFRSGSDAGLTRPDGAF